jgi:RNA polymerase sigma-70 factor, ECF subfamily
MSEPSSATADASMSADEFLVERCARADRDALRTLYERHGDRVYSIALAFFGGDEASARDVTQNVFVKLMERAHQFRGSSAFKTWLHRLVMNTCLDERRRSSRAELESDVQHFDGVDERSIAPPEAVLIAERTGLVHRAVAELPELLRAAVLLRHFEDMSYDEMAVVLECAPGTVASRLHRAHALLAKRLAHYRAVGGA